MLTWHFRSRSACSGSGSGPHGRYKRSRHSSSSRTRHCWLRQLRPALRRQPWCLPRQALGQLHVQQLKQGAGLT